MTEGCYCDEDQGAGYTYDDEYGECDFCISQRENLVWSRDTVGLGKRGKLMTEEEERQAELQRQAEEEQRLADELEREVYGTADEAAKEL